MIKNLSLFVCCFFSAAFYCNAQDPVPVLKWQKILGGSNEEFNGRPSKISMIDRDGGYLIAGATASTDGDVSGLHYSGTDLYRDIWVAKLDAQKNISWSKCLGGTGTEDFYALELAHDNGYIIAGETNSTDGHVTGSTMHGDGDAWIVRLDNTGNVVWQKCYGGSKNDGALCIQKTNDGYIFVGTTMGSTDGDVSGSHGENRDIWLVKIDKNGVLQWQKCLGGISWDVPTDIKVTPDGGFILTGMTSSNDGDVTGVHSTPLGNPVDVWVVKLTGNGVIEWQKCLGGTKEDHSSAIKITATGDYIITGVTNSNDGDVSGHHVADPTTDDTDAWVVKLSANGTILWQKCFGGTQPDEFSDLQILPDQSVVAVGATFSSDGDVSNLIGERDCWLVKFENNTGNMIWEKTFGSTAFEDVTSISLTNTGSFIVGGTWYGDIFPSLWLFEAGFNSPVPAPLPTSSNTEPLINRTEIVSSVYPNPGNGNISLKLRGAIKGNVQVQVLDQLGRLVTTRQFGEQHTALFKTALDLGNLPKGSYLLRIIANDKAYMHKLLIH